MRKTTLALALILTLLMLLLAALWRAYVLVPRRSWEAFQAMASRGADTVVRVDTVWQRDTVRLFAHRPLEPKVAAPDSSCYYEDVRRDSTLWLRIADTIRHGRIAHRMVEYQLIRPLALARTQTVRQYVPVALPHGLQSPLASSASSPWGGLLSLGVDASAGWEARAGVRYRGVCLGAGVRREPSGRYVPGVWAGYAF